MKKQGHLVILTTARSEKYREELIPYLQELGIEYDKLVMGLAVGPRVLINDRKTSKPFVSQANSIEIKRNAGISDIDIDSFTRNNNIEIVHGTTGPDEGFTTDQSYHLTEQMSQ